MNVEMLYMIPVLIFLFLSSLIGFEAGNCLKLSEVWIQIIASIYRSVKQINNNMPSIAGDLQIEYTGENHERVQKKPLTANTVKDRWRIFLHCKPNTYFLCPRKVWVNAINIHEVTNKFSSSQWF